MSSTIWCRHQRPCLALPLALLAALYASAAAARPEPPPSRALVQQIGLRAAALRPAFVAKHRTSYRVTVPLGARADAIRDQKYTGRCWLYAATSVLSNKVLARRGTAPSFSISYLNHHSLRRQAFGVIEKAVASDGRMVSRVDEIGEGGQFPYAMQLVRDHGLLPESAMPSKTFDADRSGVLVSQIKRLVAAATSTLGDIDHEDRQRRGAVAADYKRRVVELLDLSLGKPPKSFVVDGKRYSPTSYREALGIAKDSLRYVALINRPNKSDQRITTKDLTGAFSSFSSRQLKSRQLRRIAQHALDAGEALYFSANAGSNNPHRVDDKRAPAGAKGILSVGAFNYGGLVPVVPVGKRDRLEATVDTANHAMVLTGYDTRGKSHNVRKWRVDNSWGTDDGDGGRLHMYNDYFGAYVERLFVPERLVPAKLR